MQSVVVEPADVFDDGELELGPGAPDAVGDQLGLEAVDEALGQRVVVRVADRADRRQDVVVIEDLGVVSRGVLTAAVGVSHEPEVSARLAGAERHSERVEDEVGAHVTASCQPTTRRLNTSMMNAK